MRGWQLINVLNRRLNAHVRAHDADSGKMEDVTGVLVSEDGSVLELQTDSDEEDAGELNAAVINRHLEDALDDVGSRIGAGANVVRDEAARALAALRSTEVLSGRTIAIARAVGQVMALAEYLVVTAGLPASKVPLALSGAAKIAIATAQLTQPRSGGEDGAGQ